MNRPPATQAERFSKLVLDVSSSTRSTNFYSLFADALRAESGAHVAVISEFDQRRRVFKPVAISGDEETLDSAAELIGRKIPSIETPVPEERISLLISSPSVVTDNLADATFGAISDEISDRLAQNLVISGFQRLSLIAEGSLIGSVLLAFGRGGSPLDENAAILLANICGLLIREHIALAENLDLDLRSRRLIEILPESVFEADSSGNLVYANAPALSSFGYTKEELEEGINIFSLIASEDLERAKQNIGRTFEKGTDRGPTEYTLIRRDGSRFSALISSTVLKLQGDRMGLLGVLVDLSKTKHAESSRAQLVAAVEQSAEGIVITDNIARIQYVNPAFLRITGAKQEDIIGQLPFSLSKGSLNKGNYADMWKSLQHGDIWHGLISGERKDGSIYYLDTTASPVRGESGAITNYVAAMRDLTYERELEARYRHSQKMEAIGRLAGGIAHDFNNLMTAIAGYAELIGDTFDDSDSRRDDLREIVQAVDRASTLTGQLLTFSRKQVVHPERTSVPRILSSMQIMLRRLLGEDIQMIYNLDETLPEVFIDPVQIEQIIMNLAVNARDAMPAGGTLKVAARKDGRDLVLTVSDNGEGMPKETLSRIFEPFFTTKPPGEGTGLGLSTIYGIVEQNSGTIDVDSGVGEGTVFTIRLPAMDAGDEKPEDHSGDIVQAQKKDLILLVEDEELVRNLTAKVLVRAGFEVLAFGSPLEAVSKVVEEKPQVSLLITDVVMPEMNGRDVADRVAELIPGIKILFMSGYTNEVISSQGIENGDVPFIQKPFTPAVLTGKIAEMLSY